MIIERQSQRLRPLLLPAKKHPPMGSELGHFPNTCLKGRQSRLGESSNQRFRYHFDYERKSDSCVDQLSVHVASPSSMRCFHPISSAPEHLPRTSQNTLLSSLSLARQSHRSPQSVRCDLMNDFSRLNLLPNIEINTSLTPRWCE
jgi:hypothetical protein